MFEKIFVVAQVGAQAVLLLLIGLSVLSVAAILERFFTLRKIRASSEQARARLQDLLQSNQLHELEKADIDRNTLEGRALTYALRHAKDNGVEGVSEVINGFALMERPRLERSLSFLATVGSNAPFIGLLGTVFGIMKAFNDLGVSQGDAATVMVGIAEALGATAVGLFVAIPAVIAYNYFQKQVKFTMQGLETVRELTVAYAKRRGR